MGSGAGVQVPRRCQVAGLSWQQDSCGITLTCSPDHPMQSSCHPFLHPVPSFQGNLNAAMSGYSQVLIEAAVPMVMGHHCHRQGARLYPGALAVCDLSGNHDCKERGHRRAILAHAGCSDASLHTDRAAPSWPGSGGEGTSNCLPARGATW